MTPTEQKRGLKVFFIVKKTILDSINDKEDKASFNLSSKMGGYNYRCDIEIHSQIDDKFIVPVQEQK